MWVFLGRVFLRPTLLAGLWRVLAVFLLNNSSGRETGAAAAFSRKAGTISKDQAQHIPLS